MIFLLVWFLYVFDFFNDLFLSFFGIFVTKKSILVKMLLLQKPNIKLFRHL